MLAELLALLLSPFVGSVRSRDDNQVRTGRTPEIVTELAEGEVFVFGGNAAGHPGAGAARAAYESFVAEWGVGAGRPVGRTRSTP